MSNLQFAEKLKTMLLENGASDVGFATYENGFHGLFHSATIVVALSRKIVQEIDQQPTPMYFHHYRSVNMLLDMLTLRAGQLLAQNSYQYYPIAASQSINTDGNQFNGAFSHKEAAVRSGLGRIGRSALFLHKEFGAAVRLATVFTDCDFGNVQYQQQGCGNCNACVLACPAMAITGNDYVLGAERDTVLDAQACSEYMKRNFQHIGRGSVCGICIKTCLFTEKKEKTLDI